VLKVLRRSKKSNSVTHIAIEADLPRTTTGFVLNELAVRGLALRIKVRNHFEWQLAPTSALPPIFASDSTKTRTLIGVESIEEVTRTISSLSRGERVYVVQGNVSAEKALKKLSREYLHAFHSQLKERQVIIEGVVGQRALKLFREMSADNLRSHKNRLVIAHVVPDRYVDFDCDLYVVRNTVFISHYRDLRTRIITDPAFASAIQLLITYILDNAERIDLNEFIEKEIESRC
jgi:Icc-related predicted phosphoesterase